MAVDRATRMIRVLVVLMFAELVIVIMLVDSRLDDIEATAATSRAPAVARDYGHRRDPSRRDVQGAAALELTSDMADGAAPRTAPDQRPHLTEDDRRWLVEELYRTERLWRRTSGVLEGLATMQKRRQLREFSDAERAKVVEVARDYAGRRVQVELAVMASDLPDMDEKRLQLGQLDAGEAERIEKELGSFLNPAEAKLVARVVVPRMPWGRGSA